MTIVLCATLVGIGYVAYDIHWKSNHTQSLLGKARMLHQKADGYLQQGDSEQARIYLDSCEYVLGQVKKLTN